MLLKVLIISSSDSTIDYIKSAISTVDNKFDLLEIRNQGDFTLGLMQNHIDIVIFDDSNTWLNVKSAIDTILLEHPAAKIFVISGNLDPQHIVSVIKSGAYDFFDKDDLRSLSDRITSNYTNRYRFQGDTPKRVAEAKIEFPQNSDVELSDIAKKTEQRLSRIIDASPVAIAFVRVMDNKIIQINDSCLEMLGYSREEVLGKTAKELNIWVDYRQRISLIEQMGLKKFVRNREVTFRNKDGKNIPIVLSIEKIEFKDEEPLFIFFALDISNQVKYSAELKKSLDQEKESIILKNRLISMISHELRSPLTTVMLSTDMLRRYGEKLNSEEKNNHYDRIQNTVLKLTKLMETVLTIGRLESGNFEFQPDYIDLVSFCESVIENVEFNFERKRKIELKYEVQCSDLRADENLLYLIVSNLLANAVKYTPEDKGISLHLVCRDMKAVFTIEDEGIGIPKHELDNLFKSFFRASNVGESSGYGLGLAIVKKCVDTHNGSITVDSHLNKGTKIIVEIPVD
jgi:PAS domain S-box-containing protein